MREHEVPTHVQTEDKVLLWFTFPQIVAVVAVCALSYGAYRYAPVGPSAVRIAISVLLALTGIVMIVGKIGGRRLPLVAADLLRYRLGARVHAGIVGQLVRPEPPAPVQPPGSGPGPLNLVARRAKRALRSLRKKRRRGRARPGGRSPFRAHGWFGKRRNSAPEERGGNAAKNMIAAMAILALAAAAALPQAALADKYWENEIGFEIAEPVEGRRLFVEALTVSGDRAAVTLRAATYVDLRVRAFGGPDGGTPRFWGIAKLEQGERIGYSLPLDGPEPSLTFAWEDSTGQAGALTIDGEKMPHPLPEVDGDLCDARLVTLGWVPGVVSGIVESECVERIEHALELETVAGHANVSETALMDAGVTAVTGTVTVETDTGQARVPFVPDGETRFRVGVPTGEDFHSVAVDIEFEATLHIALPPLTRLTHRAEHTELLTETVRLYRPGTQKTVSNTIQVVDPDGTTRPYTISATLSVPGEWIERDVTFTVTHVERVEAEVAERLPINRTTREILAMDSGAWADDPFRLLFLPEPEPVDPLGEQEPAGSPEGWGPSK